jgi:hypothetical protein
MSRGFSEAAGAILNDGKSEAERHHPDSSVRRMEKL